MEKVIIAILITCTVLMTGCMQNDVATTNNLDKSQDKALEIFKVGVIMPLSGDVASLGEPLLSVQKKALDDINAKWAKEGKNKKIEFIIEDGKCSPKDSLTAIQSLSNIEGVKIILGGLCSGETLGIAPYAEANHILVLSSGSTSPKVTDAGDYIFRNVGSDSYWGVLIAEDIIKKGYTQVTILSENNDYAQDLREEILNKLKEKDIYPTADEIINSGEKELKTNMLKIKESNPQALIILPGSEVTANRFVENIQKYLNLDNIQLYGIEIMGLGSFLQEDALEGMITFKSDFDDTNIQFQKLANETGCPWGKYCATVYDGVLLLSEMIDKCGDDTDCIKEGLYNAQNWQGKYQGAISFDENGDIKEEFSMYKVQNHKLVQIN